MLRDRPCHCCVMPPEKRSKVNESVFDLAAKASTWEVASELLWAAIPEKMLEKAHIYEHNWHARHRSKQSASYIY